MKDRPDSPFQVQVLEHLVSPKVIGSFYINNRQYLIIHIEQNFADSAQTDLAHYLKCPPLSKARQFQVDGQQCAIVEADQISTADHTDMISRLTERELQIVKLVASGYPNKLVAKQLHISEWTVSTHLRRIFTKLDVESRAAMVYRCASIIH
jgi:DNA-binding CsgD family transcriptional regulator